MIHNKWPLEHSEHDGKRIKQNHSLLEENAHANTPVKSAAIAPPPFQLKATSDYGMDNHTLNQMSNAFDTDFSDIKIHQNSESASNVGALAYTQGNDIHFSPGQFDPDSSHGRELLGHELTHVVQQREGRVQANNEINGMPLNNDPGLELEADVKGAQVAK